MKNEINGNYMDRIINTTSIELNFRNSNEKKENSNLLNKEDDQSKLFESERCMNDKSIQVLQKIEEEKNWYESEIKENSKIKIKNNPTTNISNNTNPNVVLLNSEVDAEEINFKSKHILNNQSKSKSATPNRRESYLFNTIAFRGINLKPLTELESTVEKIRRYNKSNIDNGKNFFKFRYIKEKFEELMNLSTKVDKVDKARRNSLEGDSIEYGNPLNNNNNINNQNMNLNLNLPLNSFLNEDKNAIKFNSLYLQKLEKGIFSFNLKKFEDSYNYLHISGIVKNENEFGELLLVTTGFDKYIVGDFLSKEKSPNKEKKVLNSFMKCIDFCNTKFLDAFRFLLSRLNLPKDSSLILEIVDAFSIVYYDDNKEHGNFKDTNSVYLLSSTVLSLNTMFSRSDIKDMRIFKKEEFVKMNKTVNANLLENIYDELKIFKMDIIYDYNEVIYKRLSIDIRGASALPQINENTDLNGEEVISMLKQGESFIKYGNHHPHPRIVKLSEDEKRLYWFSIGGCAVFKKNKFLEINDISDIYIGATASKILEKNRIPQNYDSNCFSIATNKRTLDLRKDDENICKKWYQAIKFILKRTKSISELKSNKKNIKDIINKNEIISDIWKTEILPNWHVYRKFVIVKKNGKLIEGFHSAASNSSFSAIEVNKKNKEKFAKVMKNLNKEKILTEKDKSEFFYLWTLGIPEWLRKKIWMLIIGNESGITENLVNYHLHYVEEIKFDNLINIFFNSGQRDIVIGTNSLHSGNIVHENNKILSSPMLNTYKKISNTHLNTVKLKTKLHITDDAILNEIIADVIKISKKFESQIKDNNIELHIFMQDLFKVVRVFTLFRPDIIYTKQISYISTILLLNSENYYSAFVSLVNFSIPSFIMKFLTRDEIYIKIRLDFYEKLMSKYVPIVYKHFVKMDVTTSLYFFRWIENVFIKTFKYGTLLRLWDIYLLKGEVFLYEVSLCLIKIQEKDLVRISVIDVLKNLKKLSLQINEDEFFDLLQIIDISEDYKKLINENSLAREKGVLFQSFMVDWI